MIKVFKKSRGFGLIEVLVAVAVIAGIALLVSQFVVSQGKQQTNIRSSASCEARLSSIVSKIKEIDNNTNITHWMPQASEMLPTEDEVRSRLRLDIIEGYDGATAGEFLDLAEGVNHTTYSQVEVESAELANNYQLISSATSTLASVYPAACNAVMEANDLPDGQFKSLLQAELGGLNGISLRVQRLNSSGAASCDANWQPVPLNVNPNANVNNADLVSLTISATYQDEATSIEKSCTANATFSPGSDLVAAPLLVTVTPIGLTLAPSGSGTFCGNSTTASFQVEVGQGANPEPGVQYFCRLDYVRLASSTNRYNGTGWFVCTMPEAAIGNVETTLGVPGTRLSVSALSLPNPNTVRFTVSNAAEGTYKLHVKSIDVARNETALVREIRIDLTRPQISEASINLPSYTSVPGFPVNRYRFQCNNAHTPWVSPPNTGFTEAVTVSTVSFAQGYWNTLAPNPAFNCSSADVNLASPLSNGPKVARFAVCDECNIASGGDIEPYLWFVDSSENLTPTAPELNGGQLRYDAGDNDDNPYVLTHRLINNVGSQRVLIL
jgi:prepilin-type N-terminal cleavage/methylation domain-containing protein